MPYACSLRLLMYEASSYRLLSIVMVVVWWCVWGGGRFPTYYACGTLHAICL
jgi:hypothetical protein